MKGLGVKLNQIKDFAKANKKVVSCVFVAILCLAFLFFGGMSGVKSAFVNLQRFFEGNEEISGKDKHDNGNGTYTLELSVTGSAATNVSKVDNVNVVIVYDRSNSMTRSAGQGSSRTRAQEAEAIVTDFVQKLFTYQDSQHPENIQVSLITFAQCATQVSLGGNTWSSSETQVTNAIDAISYNNRALGTNWYDALKMAENLVNDSTKTDSDPTFVIFVTDGAPTANSDSCAQGISPEGQPYTRFIQYYNPARQYARDIQTRDDTTLFGIYAFGTDEDLLDELMYYSVVGEDRPEELFDGGSDKDEYNKDVYFNASNTTELQNAIDHIFEKVVQALGITEVTITDGTTNQVQTSTEVVSLLTIKPNSFKYWLTVPTDANGDFQRVNLISGNTINYHVEDKGNGNLTVSWTENGQSKSVDLKGTMEAPGFKYQWTGANDLYNVAPPDASADDGTVVWNLDREHVGTLLNGVKYTVTFDVYPSQYTYDKVAELQNAADPAASEEERLAAIEAAYNAEDQAIKDYLVYNGDGTFSLRTNTEAFLDYTDTRTGETYHGKYKNPEPVTTDSNELSIEKVWLNEVDKIFAPKNTPINLTLIKDGEELSDTIIEVKNDNDWQNSMVISTGLLITTRDEENNINGIEVLTSGHDFSLKEPTDLSNSEEFKAYQWEFVMETVHPMVVDGVEKMLVLLKDEEVPADTSNELYQFVHDENATYYNDGTNVFYKIEDKNHVAHVYYEKTSNNKLNAYNTRKSNFNFTKEIDGDAPKGKKFKFFFTVNNSYPEEDVWYSVCDVTVDPECKAAGSIIGDVETDGTPEIKNGSPTGYFSVPSGRTTYVVIQENWNVRVTNVGTGTTYTIVEDEETLPNNFSLKSIVGDAIVDSPELPLAATQIDDIHWEFNGITYEKVTKTENNETKVYYEYTYHPDVDEEAYKIEGEVVAPNTEFKTVFTNTYSKTHVTVNKEWDKQEQDSVNVTLYANGTATDKTGTISKDADGNYTYVFEDLDVSDSNGVINYSVIEDDITGYKAVYAGTTDIYVSASDVTSTDNKVRVTVKEGETVLQTVELTEDDEYETTITGIDFLNEDGTLKDITVTSEDATLFYTFNNRAVTITNREVVSRTVVKDWIDNNDQDGYRPDELIVTVVEDGTETERTVTLNAANSWTVTLDDLFKYDSDGNEITYSWKEDISDVSDYYAEEDATVSGTTTTLHNKHVLETTSTTVTKRWDDNANQDGARPTSLTVTLVKNGTATTTTAVLNAANNWTVTLDGLDKKEGGQPITYTWTEPAEIDGYEPRDPVVSGTSYTLVNYHEIEKTSTTVVKEWHDKNNQDGVRPTSLTVTMVKNGTATTTTAVLNADNNWSATVDDLDMYAGGQPISYTWTEPTEIDGYEEEDPTVSGTTYQLNNKHDTATTSTTVVKRWDDNANQDGVRPTSLTVTLVKNGTATTTTAVLNADNSWTATIEGLDMNEGGQPITYTWTEPEEIDDYEAKDPVVSGTSYTLVNYHKTEKTSTTVVKEWHDKNNQDGIRPTSLTVTLVKNGTATDTTAVLNADNNWTATIDNLDMNAGGQPISYTWTEPAEISGYEEEDPTISGTTYQLNNKHDTATTSTTVVKEWHDNENNDGKRPTSLTVTLVRNGVETTITAVLNADNNWTATIDGLDMNEAGQPITYTWSEPEISYYSPEDPTIDGTTYQLNNKHDPILMYLQAVKDWQDENDHDGKRPVSIIAHLFANGTEIESATLNKDNNWTYTFTDKPKYLKGQEISYTITETDMEGNEIADYELEGGEPSVTEGEEGNTLTLTNTHTLERTSICVTKEWRDNNDQDGYRPDTVIIKLLGKTEESEETEYGTHTLDETNDHWSYTFENLYVYDAGLPITYRVVEEGVDTDIYTPSVEKTNDGFNVVNEHKTDKTSVTVTKDWQDNNNQDGKRSDVVVTLFADGEQTEQTITLTEENSYTATFENLEKFRDKGTPIVYTVDELEDDVPTGYKKTNIAETEDGFVITNEHEIEKTFVSGEKIWNIDANIYEFDLPESITVILKANGEQVATQEVSPDEQGNWTYSFTDLDKYSAGEVITYTVDEVPIVDYDTKVNNKTYVIENTYNPEFAEITVKKTWEDESDQDGIRPEVITIDLIATVNGEELYRTTREITGANDTNVWEAKFTDLPKYATGEEITWIAEEHTVEDYEKSEVALEITNTYSPEVVSYVVIKNWDDDNDHDKKRPESITVRLYDDLGSEVATLELTAENEWIGEFTDLPKFRDHGTPIVYSIKEDAVEDYEEPEITEIDDYTAEVTNTHEREKVSIYITKTWEDNNDEYKVRPDSITVDVYANGELVTTASVSAEENWETTITGLDKYNEDGEEILYTVKERPVEKYIPAYNDYNIINKFDDSDIEIIPPDTGVYTGQVNTGILYFLSVLGILSLGFKKIHE